MWRKNLELEQGEAFDPSTAGRLGKVLGVDYLISGAAQQSGQQYRLNAKRVEAETGTVLENVVLDGSDLFALQDELAETLARRIAESEIRSFLPAGKKVTKMSKK